MLGENLISDFYDPSKHYKAKRGGPDIDESVDIHELDEIDLKLAIMGRAFWILGSSWTNTISLTHFKKDGRDWISTCRTEPSCNNVYAKLAMKKQTVVCKELSHWLNCDFQAFKVFGLSEDQEDSEEESDEESDESTDEDEEEDQCDEGEEEENL